LFAIVGEKESEGAEGQSFGKREGFFPLLLLLLLLLLGTAKRKATRHRATTKILEKRPLSTAFPATILQENSRERERRASSVLLSTRKIKATTVNR
jgi:hypothetical protein